jgi:hypothetical protein
MTPNELDLLHGYLNGTIGEADFARLQALLRVSAEARRVLRDLSAVDAKLQDLGAANPATLRLLAVPVVWPVRFGWFSWNPLAAAAAGLVFGLFSASVVWGYVGTYASKAITLLEESFESGSAPLVTGMPTEPGRWGGDYSEQVGEFGGVNPAKGKKMLRFLRADYEGKPVHDGYVADLFRIVDLRGESRGVERGDASVLIEARFNALPQADLRGMTCGVTIYALDALPPAGTRDDAFLKRLGAGLVETGEPDAGPRILATAARSEKAETTGEAWQTVRSELRLPAQARYCLIHLRAHLNGSYRPETPKPVEFAGLFVDDVRVTLTHRPPLP